MNRLLQHLLVCNLLLLAAVPSSAQETDKIFKPNIHSVKLHVKGDQLSYPIMRLNSGDQLELHFDDMDADVKYYFFNRKH